MNHAYIQNLLLQYLKDLRDRGAKVSFHCIYSDDKINWKMINVKM